VNATDEVHILDQVTLTNDQVALWLGRFHDRYLPGARGRGMRLDRVWRSPAGPDATTVHILWTLPSIRAFYAMRGAAGADPSVAAFWMATDGYAIERGRRALQPTIPSPAAAPNGDIPSESSVSAPPTGANA
jgi:hypothetical protein